MIQKVFLKKSMGFTLGIFAACMFQSCFESGRAPEVSIDKYAESHPLKVVSVEQRNYDMYVDFSDGIVFAYRNDTTSSHMLNLVNKVLQSENLDSAYAMGQNRITNISNLSSTQFYNKVIDRSNYVDIMAPIEQTLKAIVEGQDLAILVTDYEEYTSDRRIQKAAYAANYFNTWIDKGGNIVFYAFPYKEKNLSKHLYLTVFDNSTNSLDKEIQEALEGLDHNYIRFNLNNSLYSIRTNYPSQKQGGCNHDPKEMDDIISYTIERGDSSSWHFIRGQYAEYYPFEESWEDIYKGAQATIADYKETPKNERENMIDYKFLIGNLSIDFSELNAYSITELEAIVYNIQDDIDAYSQFVYDSIGYDPTDVDDDGNPLEKPVYTPAKYTVVPDMLVFNGAIEEKVAKVSIDFSSKFSGILPSTLQDEQTIAVDIKISKCECDYSKIEDLFLWGDNSSLAQSVRLTMQKFNPKGEILYRYYIKNLQQ